SVVRTVMSPAVTGMTFQFFDGTQWLDQWDTTSEDDSTTASQNGIGTSGLPHAVQIILYFAGQPARGAVNRLPSSNGVDPDAPHLMLVVSLPGAEGSIPGQETTGATTP